MGIPTVPLGSQGLRASRQGLGCMGMSAFYGSDDEKQSIATLEVTFTRDELDRLEPLSRQVVGARY
jgi:aryl-alcohol dehydrogenase-like predicted oxidoreductase